MRAVLTNVGIRGDAQPFPTLTVKLRRHNHRPVLALAPEWRQRVEALDLEFVALRPRGQIDMRSVMANDSIGPAESGSAAPCAGRARRFSP